MKVVAFNGSAREGGNTSLLLKTVLAQLESRGIDTELVELAHAKITPCKACGKCRKKPTGNCPAIKDDVTAYIDSMRKADGILLGSPVYFADVTPQMKALIDRAGYVARGNDHMFARKVGASVVAVRRAGAIHALDTMNHFFLISQMVVPGSSYWNLGVGGPRGEVDNDAEGMATMRDLGENMAWVLKRLKA